MYNKVIEIRERLEQEYHDNMCSQLQPVVEPLVLQLQALYPKRKICMIFDNGGCVVSFENTKNMYNPVIDCYGNLKSFSESNPSYNRNFFRFFEDSHPLIQLVKVLDELYNIKGYTPCLDDIK